MSKPNNDLEHKYGLLLGSRVFDINDQLAFGAFSGDVNPIHIDQIVARKTLAGQCIVHGIHSLLWALDLLTISLDKTIVGAEVRFLNSIYLGERIDCFWNDQSGKISLLLDSTVVCSIKFQLGEPLLDHIDIIPFRESRKRPVNLIFADILKINNVEFKVCGNPDFASTLFPNASRKYGKAAICELAHMSEIIGMQLPGLNSLFLSLSFSFLKGNTKNKYWVSKSDARFETVDITAKGRTIDAVAKAVFRPTLPKVRSMAELAGFVAKDEFSGITALIVGGSRGIGEITAKLISAGGGKVKITYNKGHEDACRVRDEIVNYGGYCDIFQMTIGQQTISASVIGQVDQIYYFATPKIFGKRSPNFDNEILEDFRNVYVQGFEQACKMLLSGLNHLAAFYPSTVAIDHPIPALAEYIEAKLEGEALCEILPDSHPNLRVICSRLPRIETDQTLSLIKVQSSDVVEVMIPIIREMTKN